MLRNKDIRKYKALRISLHQEAIKKIENYMKEKGCCFSAAVNDYILYEGFDLC